MREHARQPRANVPPEVIRPYAEARERALCTTLWACVTWAVATLPAALGGLGLQSAVRTAPAAYWGAWADTLGYLSARQPGLARACVDALPLAGPERRALCAAQAAANLLRTEGHACPTWESFLDDSRASPTAETQDPW